MQHHAHAYLYLMQGIEALDALCNSFGIHVSVHVDDSSPRKAHTVRLHSQVLHERGVFVESMVRVIGNQRCSKLNECNRDGVLLLRIQNTVLGVCRLHLCKCRAVTHRHCDGSPVPRS